MEIWHNPRCSKSRQTLTILTDAGAKPTIREYLVDPPTMDQLTEVLGQLEMEPWQLVRRGEPAFAELGMSTWDREDRARWIEAMVAHPKLIERPVVISGGRAVLGRPPESVRDLFA